MKNKTKTYRSAEINAEVDKVVQSIQGLTKREYFAAMALSGMLANPEYTKISECYPPEEQPKWLSKCALNACDHMISELNKKP